MKTNTGGVGAQTKSLQEFASKNQPKKNTSAEKSDKMKKSDVDKEKKQIN